MAVMYGGVDDVVMVLSSSVLFHDWVDVIQRRDQRASHATGRISHIDAYSKGDSDSDQAESR